MSLIYSTGITAFLFPLNLEHLQNKKTAKFCRKIIDFFNLKLCSTFFGDNTVPHRYISFSLHTLLSYFSYDLFLELGSALGHKTNAAPKHCLLVVTYVICCRKFLGPVDDIIVFALSCSLRGIPLHVCNEAEYGMVLVPLEDHQPLEDDLPNLQNTLVEITAKATHACCRMVLSSS